MGSLGFDLELFDEVETEVLNLQTSVEANFRLPADLAKENDGVHFFLEDRHLIHVKKGLSRKYANEVLWHELAHAVQAEFIGYLLWGWVYLNPQMQKLLEDEADEFAEEMAAKYKLVV